MNHKARNTRVMLNFLFLLLIIIFLYYLTMNLIGEKSNKLMGFIIVAIWYDISNLFYQMQKKSKIHGYTILKYKYSEKLKKFLSNNSYDELTEFTFEKHILRIFKNKNSQALFWGFSPIFVFDSERNSVEFRISSSLIYISMISDTFMVIMGIIGLLFKLYHNGIILIIFGLLHYLIFFKFILHKVGKYYLNIMNQLDYFTLYKIENKDLYWWQRWSP